MTPSRLCTLSILILLASGRCGQSEQSSLEKRRECAESGESYLRHLQQIEHDANERFYDVAFSYNPRLDTCLCGYRRSDGSEYVDDSLSGFRYAFRDSATDASKVAGRLMLRRDLLLLDQQWATYLRVYPEARKYNGFAEDQ